MSVTLARFEDTEFDQDLELSQFGVGGFVRANIPTDEVIVPYFDIKLGKDVGNLENSL